MKFRVIPRTDDIPAVDHSMIVVKYIDCADYGETYTEEITPELIARLLHDVPDGIEVSLCLDPDGEQCDIFLDVVFDGEWLSLCYGSEEIGELFLLQSGVCRYSGAA